MKTLKLAVVLTAVLPLAAAAQDAVKVDPGHYKVLIDNPSVRVLKVTYSPGAKSPMHSHPDAMLVSLAGLEGPLHPAGRQDAGHRDRKEAAPYTPASTHSPANVGTTPVDAILVEFKAKDPGTATLPAARAGMTMTTLAEGPRAIAFKTTAAAGLPRGRRDRSRLRSGRDLARSQRHVARGRRQAPMTKWQRGTAQFIGRGVKHESKNTSGRPIEFVIVAIK